MQNTFINLSPFYWGFHNASKTNAKMHNDWPKIHEITQHSAFLVNKMQCYDFIQPSTGKQVGKVSPLVKKCFLLL